MGGVKCPQTEEKRKGQRTLQILNSQNGSLDIKIRRFRQKKAGTIHVCPHDSCGSRGRHLCHGQKIWVSRGDHPPSTDPEQFPMIPIRSTSQWVSRGSIRPHFLRQNGSFETVAQLSHGQLEGQVPFLRASGTNAGSSLHFIRMARGMDHFR